MYDQKTQTYYTPEQLNSLMAANPDNAERMAQSFGFNSSADMMSGQNSVQNYQNGQIVKGGDGKYYKWNEKAQSFGEPSQAEITAASNPSASSASNLSVLGPTTFLDNPIPQYIQLGVNDPITGKNSWETAREVANAEALNPTGMDAQTQALELLRKNAGASDLERIIQESISKSLSGGPASYSSDIYKRAKLEFEANAAQRRAEEEAKLRANGIGLSTIVNDVNAGINRELDTNLQKSFFDANTAGQNYIAQLMQQGIGMENNIGNRGQSAAQNISGIGTNQANIFNNAQNRLKAVNDEQSANSLLNLGLQNQAWDKKNENMKYLLNYPYATNAAGNNSQTAGTDASNIAYQGALNAYAKKQSDIGTLFSGLLTNAFGKK